MPYAREYTLRPSSAPAPVARRSEGGPQPSRPAPHYPDTARQPIGKAERVKLLLACKAVFDKLSAAGVAMMGRTAKEKFELWRHDQVRLATDGRAHGLTTLMRADWRNVWGRLMHLSGLDDEKAFEYFVTRTGHTPAGDAVETVEQCDKWIAGILAKVKRHFATQGGNAQQRTEAWLQAIVEHKEASYGKPWRKWDVPRRVQLYWTLKNRYAALTETGDPANRNKSQREAARRKRESDTRDHMPDQLALLPECPF